MKYKMLLLDILLLIVVVYLFSMCSDGNRNIYNDDNATHSSYNINHYLDTIGSHIILTTVCDEIKTRDISVSTLELKD